MASNELTTEQRLRATVRAGAMIDDLSIRIKQWHQNTLRDTELTDSLANALFELGSPLTMTMLAERLKRHPSGSTAIADRLESLGLVERVTHPTDRRSKILRLTPKGEERRAVLEQYYLTSHPLAGSDSEKIAELTQALAAFMPEA